MFTCQRCGNSYLSKPYGKKFKIVIKLKKKEDLVSAVKELLVCKDCKNKLKRRNYGNY